MRCERAREIGGDERERKGGREGDEQREKKNKMLMRGKRDERERKYRRRGREKTLKRGSTPSCVCVCLYLFMSV